MILRGVFVVLAWMAVGHAIAAPVKFSDRLHAKFHHDRCLQCHQFNSQKHDGRGFNSHKSRYLCTQCHTQQLIGLKPGDWFAPEEKLDHTGMNATETCKLIKRNMGQDSNKMLKHLLYDPRIKWAIESGLTPGGQKEPVPGGYKEWENEARAWVHDGMRCE